MKHLFNGIDFKSVKPCTNRKNFRENSKRIFIVLFFWNNSRGFLAFFIRFIATIEPACNALFGLQNKAGADKYPIGKPVRSNPKIPNVLFQSLICTSNNYFIDNLINFKNLVTIAILSSEFSNSLLCHYTKKQYISHFKSYLHLQ
jgi:hypothetical protein